MVESDRKIGPDESSSSKPLEVTETAVSAAFLPKIIKFSELARCGDEVWIEFESQLYRLRKTKQGKLILTK